MGLRIDQDFIYQGDDWWKWRIWIEGTDAELDEIDKVVYTLHETFPDPVRVIKDRQSKFRLESSGWGIFRIHAKVHLKGGSAMKLHHDLELLYPDGEPTTA